MTTVKFRMTTTPDLDHLLKSIRACQLCADLPLGSNPVLQVSQSARILIAAQAPGIRVHETAIPFNDPSGDRLRDWLGVDRATFYDAEKFCIVPMGFCYPGTGKSGDLPPRSECRAHWHDQLFAALPQLSLHLVIGQYAHAYHLGKTRKKNLTETVKNWREFGTDRIPLPHPSPRNNIWLKKNPWFETDLIPVIQSRVATLLSDSG